MVKSAPEVERVGGTTVRFVCVDLSFTVVVYSCFLDILGGWRKDGKRSGLLGIAFTAFISQLVRHFVKTSCNDSIVQEYIIVFTAVPWGRRKSRASGVFLF